MLSLNNKYRNHRTIQIRLAGTETIRLAGTIEIHCPKTVVLAAICDCLNNKAMFLDMVQQRQ